MSNPASINSPEIIHSTVPVISTADIKKSIAYYSEILGFLPDFEYGEPVVYAGVRSGEAEIYFTHDPDFARMIEEKQIHPEIFIWISNAVELFEIHRQKGAEIIEPLADRPWGSRQYVVEEINGYLLKFAQPI